LDYGRPPLWLETNVPEGWTYDVNDFGEEVYVNKVTQHKVVKLVHETVSPESQNITSTCKSMGEKKNTLQPLF